MNGQVRIGSLFEWIFKALVRQRDDKSFLCNTYSDEQKIKNKKCLTSLWAVEGTEKDVATRAWNPASKCKWKCTAGETECLQVNTSCHQLPVQITKKYLLSNI